MLKLQKRHAHRTNLFKGKVYRHLSIKIILKQITVKKKHLETLGNYRFKLKLKLKDDDLNINPKTFSITLLI